MTRTWPSRARWAMVARSRSGFTEVATSGPGPFEDGGDDQGRGLVAAGGAEDQHRVAVLGRQQPPSRPGVRPRMTRPGSGSWTVSSRSSRPLAQTAPACLAGRGWPGRWPAARPGRCRRTAAVPPERPPTRPVKVAYMPAGPGSGPAPRRARPGRGRSSAGAGARGRGRRRRGRAPARCGRRPGRRPARWPTPAPRRRQRRRGRRLGAGRRGW